MKNSFKLICFQTKNCAIHLLYLRNKQLILESDLQVKRDDWNNLKIKIYLVTMNIEKAFNSQDHNICFRRIWIWEVSLIRSKYCYRSKNRVYWPVLLQQCILILKKVLVKEISGYLFICTVEIIFLLIKKIPQ